LGIDGDKDFELDPYYFGVWLGDGYSRDPNKIIINVKDDPEIRDFVVQYFDTIDGGYTYSYREKPDSKCMIYVRRGCKRNHNPIIEQYRKFGLYNNKSIPLQVFQSSLSYKLKVLAGIIDTDGYVKSKNAKGGQAYAIEMNRKHLILEIKRLAESCGFKVSYSERIRDNS
jgi:replicative DNA helicase